MSLSLGTLRVSQVFKGRYQAPRSASNCSKKCARRWLVKPTCKIDLNAALVPVSQSPSVSHESILLSDSRIIMCTVATVAALTVLFAILQCKAAKDDQTSASSGYSIQLQYQPDAIAFPSTESRGNYYHHHHHGLDNFDHHHHQPDFYHHHHHHHEHGYPGEDDNDSSEENSQDNLESASSTIPLELMLRFNNFTNVDELLSNFVEGSVDDLDGEEKPLLTSRFGGVERSAAVVPKAAACIPEMQTVKIVASEDPSVLYIPSCTRIERCGGCCSHSLLSCQPTDTETISYQVVKTQFVGGSKLKYMGKEVVLVEKHNKCKCGCRIQEKDCNSFQEYRSAECKCACTNIDEEKKCYKENATKLWNPDICACQCRNILQCSTGFTFDTRRCRCGAILVRRRFAEMPEQEKTGYKSEALPVIPLSDNTDNKMP